jgi:hypothetical protein
MFKKTAPKKIVATTAMRRTLTLNFFERCSKFSTQYFFFVAKSETMLLVLLSYIALSITRVESALFSSTEDLKTVTLEHTRLVFDLSRLIKNMETDLAYFKR